MENYLYIKKPKKGSPSIHRTKILTMDNRMFTFDKESVNFNTIVRAFAHNQLQWRYIESKLCRCFRVAN